MVYATKKTRRIVGLLLTLVFLLPAIAAVGSAILGANGAS
jgi:TRAP-type mannitol/chloroaromatic compound transport system permease small subunit